MRIILHVCCGVCAAGAAGVLLSEGHQVMEYFYNPNIHPRDEYLRRLEAARLTANHLGIELAEGPYDSSAWLNRTETLKDEPEGGRRCEICYRIRLQKTYGFMLEKGYDTFTSTLTISPHKSALLINRMGEEIAGGRFMARDFKKKAGFKRANDLSKEWGIYRQNYCGCLYSRPRRTAMSKWPTREEAEKILDEWVANKNLKKHAWAVEAAMRGYAVRFTADPEQWGAVGLLHDFDYEKYPDLKDHPMKGAEWLRSRGFSEELTEGVLAHAEHTGTTRDTQLKKVIYAVDELTGLIIAVALTRPSKKLADVTVEAVMKKWKEKSFAGGVDRQMIEKGASELGVPLQEHISIVLAAMQGISDRLGL